MVKIDYSSGFFNGGDLAFIVDNCATLEDINEKAVDYACDTMVNNAVGVKNVMPVIYKPYDSSFDFEPKLIGHIAMSIVDNEVVVEHQTLDGEVIDSNWSAIDFYAGKYGLAPV